RRRHTRSKRDWSSDVCSSDLLLRPKLEFIFARPLIGVSRGQLQLLTKHLARLVHEPAVVGGVEINVDISRELAVFIADHRRAARSEERRVGKECRSGWCR